MPSEGMVIRDAAANQLEEWYDKNKGQMGFSTNDSGNPLYYKDATLTVGPHGPIVLRDWNFLEEMAHFTRERIPERVVHAKGAGAFGYFEVTHDITKYTTAKIFSKIGKRTPLAARCSQVIGSQGSADTVRDPRGFALKMYTEDGIWDLVGNNTPIFFVRDPTLFIHLIHSLKPNPVTSLRNWNMSWDFFSLRPETLHQVMFMFSDRGIPDTYRHMHGYGSHTFSLINKEGKITYCKFHYRTDQGIKNLDSIKAEEIAGNDPDYARRDLYNSISEGNYPSWTFYIQIMTPQEAEGSNFNPFDITKVWPHNDYPLIPVGKIVLNRNAENYFAEIEQLAFNPANMPPGIDASPDRFLEGRLFAYGDTHRYRLGPNYQQIPVNCPYRVRNFQRDGLNVINNQGGAPNYHPNSFGGPEVEENLLEQWPDIEVSGKIGWYDLGDDDNYTQPRSFYRNVLDEDGRRRLVENIINTLRSANEQIQERTVTEFAKVDTELGDRLATGLRGKHANL